MISWIKNYYISLSTQTELNNHQLIVTLRRNFQRCNFSLNDVTIAYNTRNILSYIVEWEIETLI